MADENTHRALKQLREQENLPPHLEALAEHLEATIMAEEAGEQAEPTTILDQDGKEVSTLKVRLGPADALRILQAPAEERQAMATRILQHRQARREARERAVGRNEKLRKAKKAKRRSQRKARRKAR